MTVVAPRVIQSQPLELGGRQGPVLNSGFNVAAEHNAVQLHTDGRTAPAVEPALMLALQEQEAHRGLRKATRFDRRSQARSILDALSALQRSLLAADGETACLDELRNHLNGLEHTGDPALTQLLGSIRLRGEIEILRQRRRLEHEQRALPASDEAFLG